jgi:uncharacterized protein (DUF983 family)
MKTITKNKPNTLLSILKEKCPHCGEGQVFEKQNKLFQIPVMHKGCSVCSYHFNREPGYFIGAMYISYGLAMLQAGIAFLICHLCFPELGTGWKPFIMAIVIIVLAKKNFKQSRMLYIHLFPW